MREYNKITSDRKNRTYKGVQLGFVKLHPKQRNPVSRERIDEIFSKMKKNREEGDLKESSLLNLPDMVIKSLIK